MGLKNKLKDIQKQKSGRRQEDSIGGDDLDSPVNAEYTDNHEENLSNEQEEIPVNDAEILNENSTNEAEEDSPLLGVSKELYAKRSGRFHNISRSRLRGDRITLRCLDSSDTEHILRWLGKNPLINKIGIPFPISKEELRMWVARSSNDKGSDKILYIIEQEEFLPIGICGLFNIEDSSRRAEYSILIGDSNYQGHDYGSESTSLILDLAFNLLNLNRIESFVLFDDERAIHSFSKGGFKKEGELYEYTYVNGEYKNVFILSILKKEYEELNLEIGEV